MNNLDEKKQAIVTLLEFSLLFTTGQKKLVINNMDKLTEGEIDGLGKILAVEHKNKDKLDDSMINAVYKNLEPYLQ